MGFPMPTVTYSPVPINQTSPPVQCNTPSHMMHSRLQPTACTTTTSQRRPWWSLAILTVTWVTALVIAAGALPTHNDGRNPVNPPFIVSETKQQHAFVSAGWRSRHPQHRPVSVRDDDAADPSVDTNDATEHHRDGHHWELHPLDSDTVNDLDLVPWTLPWLSKLEQFARNAFKLGWNWGTRDEDRPHPVPAFPCKPFDDEDGLLAENRTSRQVRHRDIRIMAALGDSISAGFGMISSKLPNTRVLEYRGKVFDIGGDTNETTLPNLLSQVADNAMPQLVGPATAYSLPLAHGKDFDRAVSGAIAQDIPTQAQSLLNLLALPPARALRNEWKLVTILIGANNLCRVCFPDGVVDVTEVTTSLRTALLALRNAYPRWIVNLMGLFKVSQVYDAAQPVKYCRTVFERFHFCPCIHDGQARQDMDTLVDAYNVAFETLAHEFSNDPHFRVNFQPGFTGTDIAKYGQDFLSYLDCFHPAHNANEVMAAVTWNNMLEPVGSKTTVNDPYAIGWKCPSKGNMYIQ